MTNDSSTSALRALVPSPEIIRRARLRLQLKGAATVAVAISAYTVLVVVDAHWPVKAVSAVLLVHALLAVATGIMHDANHGSFSSSRRVNSILAYSADLLGASSWLWRRNHNVAHHHYTNVDGKDHDIELEPFARLTPTQRHRPWHRYQHLYLWPLYGFLTLKWLCFGDFQSWVSSREELRSRSPRYKRDTAFMFLGKAAHCTWALAIPMLLHPWWKVVAIYAACSWALGFALAVIFQLAHCVDRAEFFPATGSLAGDAGMRHQLATTVDFAPRTRVGRWYAGWLLGGLEYQVEHHLAPRVPHTAYRMLAREVDRVCSERGWERRSHRSFFSGVASHTRHLRSMGWVTGSPAR